MTHHLNNRFSLSSDKYNLIFLDCKKGKKPSRHYFPNARQLSRFIGELVEKESLGDTKVQLGDIHAITLSYSSVMDKMMGKFETYIDSIIENDEIKPSK
jgi:hypothetical protein